MRLLCGSQWLRKWDQITRKSNILRMYCLSLSRNLFSVMLFRARLQVLTRNAKIYNFKKHNMWLWVLKGCCAKGSLRIPYMNSMWKLSFKSNAKLVFFPLQTVSLREFRVKTAYGTLFYFPVFQTHTKSWLCYSHLFSQVSLLLYFYIYIYLHICKLFCRTQQSKININHQ